MITIYKNTETGLIRLPEPVNGCWINVINPSPEEIAQIHALDIPQDYITYPLDLDERARTERENGELLIVLRIPYFQGAAADIPYTTIPLGIILTRSIILLRFARWKTRSSHDFANGRVKRSGDRQATAFCPAIAALSRPTNT